MVVCVTLKLFICRMDWNRAASTRPLTLGCLVWATVRAPWEYEVGGAGPGMRKVPNFGVTEIQVTRETASKFCHLSEPPYVQKGILKLTLMGSDELSVCSQPASWTQQTVGDFWHYRSLGSELALPGTSSPRGMGWRCSSQITLILQGRKGRQEPEKEDLQCHGGTGAGNGWGLYCCPS